MTSSAKIAVSLPANLYEALERMRRERGQTRSALVAEAVRQWLEREQIDPDDQKYAEAYLRKPERVDELEATAGAVMSNWEPWE